MVVQAVKVVPAVSGRPVLRDKVPLAGQAVRALRGELPAKAHRVASDPPVERVPAAKERPQRMGLEVVSVQPADRVGHPLTLLGAANVPRAVRAQLDRVLLPPMVREVASDLPVDQVLVARAVSGHLALRARVLQPRSRPPRPPNLPKPVAAATPACVRHRAIGGCRCSRHRSFIRHRSFLWNLRGTKLGRRVQSHCELQGDRVHIDSRVSVGPERCHIRATLVVKVRCFRLPGLGSVSPSRCGQGGSTHGDGVRTR